MNMNIAGLLTENYNIELIPQNRGQIMKIITPYFKGKADMKIVSQVVAKLCQ